MIEIGAVIDGKYEILKEIGRGGMSTVYLSMDLHLNKQWAVKEIRKKGSGKKDEIIVNSLLAEASLMKRLDHPAFPRIVDIIDNGITIYVIMDYIEGESLDKVLKEYGPQPEALVIGWAKQLCDALSYLHSQKPPIIYRDMKPANVMLKPEGTIKIIDFGIAREYKEEKLADTTVLGTKGYAPPEQYSGQTDARSDIYALGMTMHHLLTGIDPRGGTAYAPVRMWDPDLSEGVEIIIDRCVQPAAESRYQSCSDLLYDLKHPELITTAYKKKQKSKLKLFLASALLTLVFLITGIGCRFTGISRKNSTYKAYISPSSATSLEHKIESYQNAVSLYPGRTPAYLKMLEAFEEEGHFGKSENDRFLALYNANKDAFDKNSPDTAELNYRTGLMYFNYYSEEDGSYSFSTRLQKAYSFFAANHENEELPENFAYKDLSEAYYSICSFYKEYILSSASVEEASLSDYEKLLENCESVTDGIDTMEDANAYDRLVAYNGVFNLLYDQRKELAESGIPEEKVTGLLDEIHEKATALDVKKEPSQKLQAEIREHYADYKEAVERAYENTGRRAEMEEEEGAEE
jgi:serine/threonine protein kinase